MNSTAMTTMTRTNVAAPEARAKSGGHVSRKRWYFIGGALFLIALIWWLRGTRKVAAPKEPPPRTVSTAKVLQRDVPLYLDEVGTLSAYETVEIQAQISGQITARNFKDGADVKKGDLLFTIDPRPYQAVLESAQADAALNHATLSRQEELRRKNVTTGQDLDTARANAQKADAAVAAAQVNLDHCFIKSPINGRAGLRNVDIGNVVGPGGPSLLTIQGLDPIYTDFSVAEPDVPLVRKYLGGPNVKVETDAEGDTFEPRSGSLYFIETAVQAGSGTVKARASTPNPDHALWPGQFVHARLVLDILKDAKLVPSSAVQVGQNGPFIFVVKPDSTLDLRQVKQGQAQGDLTVVSEGLK
ncbi:MAG TPA: efflux RND transporter periplasmic adaptor subunit, partial [Chthoniobacterales bacterium]|nr:efflux RND transporter periplasmic adaptor subunit [Chthoniobacterales bacterium]